MGKYVIVSYQPKEGKGQAVEDLIKKHFPTLVAEKLVTSRKPCIMKSQNGTYIEIFEWVSEQAIDAAHSNKPVQELWGQFGDVCDFKTLSSLKESADTFAHFEPVDL